MAPADRPGRHWPSINELAGPLVRRLVHDAALLRLRVRQSTSGATLVDAGIEATGGLEAGRRIAEICMGGAGWVSVTGGSPFPGWPFQVSLSSAQPVLACLASQYAGWRLAMGEGPEAYNAMASGPGRARVAEEKLFEEFGYRDEEPTACFVLETGTP